MHEMNILMSDLYAHSPNDQGAWHSLKNHLQEVADLAGQFAEAFNASNLAKWIGLWHDLGKSNPAFQEYLKTCTKGEFTQRVPHAIWGAVIAYRTLGNTERWQEIVLPIAGHHAGLYQPGELSQKIVQSLAENKDLLKTVAETAKALPDLPKCNFPEVEKRQREFFIRMLFSALVDADYLNTEQHFNPAMSEKRKTFPEMHELQIRFNEKQNTLLNKTQESSSVNRIRHEAYHACIKAASGPAGIYRLTVPTGGGKTRSSLAFALEHAVKNEMKHIVC